MQVELDAFSGRPNPRWELSAGQAAQFLALFGALKPAQARATAGDGLGYRGFIVRPNGASIDGYEEVRISRGFAVALRSGRTETLADQGGALERWLLESASGCVEPAVMDYLRSEIER